MARSLGLLTTVIAMMAVLVLAASWLGAVPTTRYVDDVTCPATGSGTLADPFCRIQDAICAAVSGDTVSVAPGTYTESIRMRPGVNVVSQGGPSVTTINGASQPCTESNYCTKRAGNQCSVVIFSSGHTRATRIEGFTITGGSGYIQGVPSPEAVAGGGIYIFSSPTVLNNVITNNVLTGPRPAFNGGGIYVANGAPLITNNTITGNRAVPGPGISGSLTYGYGGGISVGFSSDAVITNNVISGNIAGDPNVAYSISSGGGIVVWPGDANNVGPVIDRNLIADNSTDTFGGGIGLQSIITTSAKAVVTNNVIVGNTTYRNGGGIYTYFVKADIVNNTIVDNTAFLGGGLYSGQNDPNLTLPVNISNNIIEGNLLSQFGNGGGIYTLDLSATFDPEIGWNDLWGNTRNQVAGDKSDAMVIGSNGNLSTNPMFVDRPARDFHLTPGSPAVDQGLSALAPPVDKDNQPRPVDGDGVPDSPQPGDYDIGAYEACLAAAEVCDSLDNDCDGVTDEDLGSSTCGLGECETTVQNCLGGEPQTCTPGAAAPEVCDSLDNDCNGSADDNLGSSTCGVGECQRSVQNCVGGATQTCTPGAAAPEVCDGLDNDCNGLADDGLPDSDLDGMSDCFDPDDDNDAVSDPSDCAPLDATAFGQPVEVAGVDVSGETQTMVTFATQNIGTGTRYEVVSGLMSRVWTTRGFGEGYCLVSSAGPGSYEDGRQPPRPGDAWYYLIRSVNGCGEGTLGSGLADAAGSGDVCETGVVDGDGDGSASDLDCDDTSAANSPLGAEVCDGLDNNCDQIADEGNPGAGQTCGTSTGECSAGLTECSGGSLQCMGGVGPQPESCDGLDNNCDGLTDEGNPGAGQTCGSSTGECSTGLTECSGGSLQCLGNVGPQPESCDGLDNNCDGLADDGFPNTDADTEADCVDADDDNDAVADGSDCAPLDATAFAAPVEVGNLDVTSLAPDQAQVTFDEQSLGSGTLYDLATGQITTPGDMTFASGQCLAQTASSPAADTRTGPAAGTAWYYLVKSRNACGAGTYGTPARDALPSCP